MHLRLTHKLAVGAGVVAAAAAAGGAYAATQNSGTNERQAFLGDAARRLHVSPQQLESALKGALMDRLNAAVRAGRLTQAQANAIEKRLAQGAPLLGPGLRGHGFHLFGFGRPGGKLGAAAGYLGLNEQQLVGQLRAGKTLAQIAKSRGKSVSGLEQAMVAPVRSRLDQAVARGRITKSQEQQLLSRLTSRIDDLVNGTAPRLGAPPLFRHGALLPGAGPYGAPAPPAAVPGGLEGIPAPPPSPTA